MRKTASGKKLSQGGAGGQGGQHKPSGEGDVNGICYLELVLVGKLTLTSLKFLTVVPSALTLRAGLGE